MAYSELQQQLQVDSLIQFLQDGVIKAPTFAVSGNDPLQFTATTETVVTQGGVQAGKGSFDAEFANPANSPVAHVISPNKWGGGMFMAKRDSTPYQLLIATKVPGATQTTPMAYDSEALLDAALDALEVDAGHIEVGRWKILNGGTEWVANARNLDDHITSITFTSVAEKVLPTPL